jgi:hypothetical protein
MPRGFDLRRKNEQLLCPCDKNAAFAPGDVLPSGDFGRRADHLRDSRPASCEGFPLPAPNLPWKTGKCRVNSKVALPTTFQHPERMEPLLP